MLTVMRRYRYIVIVCLALVCQTLSAELWKTHFAYNNVTQIAMASDKVYAVSDGSLFSVEKQSEQIAVYNRQSGLHGTRITCIHYDAVGKQLIIGYGDGKIDLLRADGIKYISDLYNKEMTQRKTICNVTIHGRIAYLSTPYGVQTFHLNEHKLIDSYWLRPGGQETQVNDVLIANDSIYAFSDDSLYCASLQDNIVDYTYWKREVRSGRITPDPNKGKRYEESTDIWEAGGEAGINRVSKTSGHRFSYKPEGPLSNIPYGLTTSNGQVWMVQGGRWAAQYFRPGILMRYDGTRWTNISTEAIERRIDQPALDFVNVAVDPKDVRHCYVTSYGTGLYEFRNDELVRHERAGGNNTLVAVIEHDPTYYTRLDNAVFDREGRLWILDIARTKQLQCVEPDGTWHGMDIEIDGSLVYLETPSGLVIDNHHTNYKWISTTRGSVFLALLDDNGTPFDSSDDRIMARSQWTDQEGRAFKPSFIFAIMQDRSGRLWIATEQGVAYIENETDYFISDAIVRPAVTDETGENPLRQYSVRALCEVPDGSIWIGSETLGVYVLSSDATEIKSHYTTDNTAMPANGILSLACDENERVFVGTADGLVEYDPNAHEGLNGNGEEGDSELREGSMLQWRLHFSYSNPVELAESPHAIYAVANGALFHVDRADDSFHYWDKSDGLNGTSVQTIAYDPSSAQLVIAYADGRIDLLGKDGTVRQMPDIYMQAGGVSITINCITVGSRAVYLGTSVGIIAVNTRKAEITDTYYIGDEASAVNIRHVVEQGDSLFAFSEDQLFKASLHDNLVDFSFWQREPLSESGLTQATVWRNAIYAVQHDTLYRRDGDRWQQVLPHPIRWIHSHDGQLLVYVQDADLCSLQEDGRLVPVNNRYCMNDAVYTNGEYWLAECNMGLIRIDGDGESYFHTEGPNSNFGYTLQVADGQIYASAGGRWAGEYARGGRINIYDGYSWRKINENDIWSSAHHLAIDIVNVAVDPNDAGHFFAASYGTGVFEFKNYQAVQHYGSENSTLRKAIPDIDEYFYTRAEGAMWDDQGNLWVLNPTTIGQPVHVRTPQGRWVGLPLRSGGMSIQFTTPTGIWVDKRNSQWKWMVDQRSESCVVLLDDNGTPTNGYDDKCMKRSSFTDQNGNILTPTNFRCFAQDQTNRIWLGTDKGLILIPSTTDFFQSNACQRIIIPRNDGTGLGDYLLGDEQINCLAVDGGNRIWIGTANSGLYLIEDDTITAAHFTEFNSLLPSNTILSVAIMPTTGEVFVGTDKGIASYLSDASEPTEDMKHAYAFPNPVRPDYGGAISIIGLMDNTTVNIVDGSGNLVCKTRSHGGTAVWDGRLPDGRRATPGVYTALCNAQGGHTVVKILVVH